MGNDEFPSMKGRKMRQLLNRICGQPVRHSKHIIYLDLSGEEFAYGYHDDREIRPRMVRTILVNDVGLTERQALNTLRGRR